MTNGEKYKTAQERQEAFYRYCHNQACSNISAECKHEGCVLEWLDLEADEEEPMICESNPDDIQIGDTVAYKTMDDNKEEWSCFTVRAMDNEYFYEKADHGGDNIAKGWCHKVNVDRVRVEEEKPLPCPFCGHEMDVSASGCCVRCVCGYSSPIDRSIDKAIAAHNRVAKAVMESEVKE